MESEEDKKKFLMKVGIISIMILIVIFWILNIKNVFSSETNTESDKSLEQLKNIKNDFDSTLNQVNKTLGSVDTATSTINKPASSTNISENDISASSSLVNNFIKETNKIVSSGTSSVPVLPIADSVLKSKSNCPAYINCMPTVGETRDCKIPAGCENITQIAY